LAPTDLARFGADLVGALDGPEGLSWVAVQLGLLDVHLRGAAEAYELADRLDTDLGDLVRAGVRLPAAVLAAARALARGGDPFAIAEAVVTNDPQLADLVVDALGLPAAMATLSAALPDGHPVVTDVGVDRAAAAATVPRSLRDVLLELAQRNDGLHGAIDVRVLSGGGCRRHVIVDITGTKTLNPLPGPDVTGLLTDGKALVGQRTTYEAGVLAAMRRAGVRRDDEVMLVGHSEGGLVAVTTARDAVASGEFRVTHVVTAGSPIGRTAGRLPPSVQMLALENSRDVIPHLDGVANPDRRSVTTVTGTAGAASLSDAHSVADSYVPLAQDVDDSRNRSTRSFLRSARGFLSARHESTHSYTITRG
jgi:hypothetical protein